MTTCPQQLGKKDVLQRGRPLAPSWPSRAWVGTIILIAVVIIIPHHPQPLFQLRPAGGELLVQFQLPQLGWLVRRLLPRGGHK